MQPPSTPPAPGEPLYEAFYGLREQPFALTTDPRFLFMSGAHRRAHEELLTGLRRREGLLLLTGDTGMGKTTLCRAVVDSLGPRTFSALILNPYMSDAEVLRVILRDFGLVTREEIRKGAFAKADVPQLLDTLEGFLRSLLPLNSYAVVIIDEAQSLAPRVLDQIRVLGGYEFEGQRLLQIILVGQPLLVTTLKSDAMAALNERVSRRAVLGPLPPSEVDEYIQHRLAVAGGKDTVEFTAEAVNLVAEMTGGIPRRINLLCDRALEAGRLAGTNVITPPIIHRTAPGNAVAEPESKPPAPRPVAAEVAAPLESKDFDAIALDLDEDLPGEPAGESGYEPSLTFGQTDPAPQSGRRTVIVFVLILLGAALLASFGGYAYLMTRQDAPLVLPAPPPKDVGRVPDMFPAPTEDDERYLMQELERLNPGWRGVR